MNILAATFQLVSERGYISCCKDCKWNSAAADSVLPALEVSWRTCENRSKTRGTTNTCCLHVFQCRKYFVPAVYFRFSPELIDLFPSALRDANGTKLDFYNDCQYGKQGGNSNYPHVSWNHNLLDLVPSNIHSMCTKSMRIFVFYFFCWGLFKENLGCLPEKQWWWLFFMLLWPPKLKGRQEACFSTTSVWWWTWNRSDTRENDVREKIHIGVFLLP